MRLCDTIKSFVTFANVCSNHFRLTYLVGSNAAAEALVAWRNWNVFTHRPPSPSGEYICTM